MVIQGFIIQRLQPIISAAVPQKRRHQRHIILLFELFFFNRHIQFIQSSNTVARVMPGRILPRRRKQFAIFFIKHIGAWRFCYMTVHIQQQCLIKAI